MNPMEQLSYNDVYESQREEIVAEELDIDKLIAISGAGIQKPSAPMDRAAAVGVEKQLPSSQNPTDRVQAVDSANALTEHAKQLEAEQGSAHSTLDVLSWAASPLMAFGDAAIAPIADINYPNTGVVDDTVHAFKVSKDAFLKRLLPEMGEDHDQLGAAVVEKHLPNLPEWSKPTVAVGLELITDPTFSLGLGMSKTIQAGLKAKKLQEMGEATVSNKGILEEGLLKLAGFDAGFDPDKLTSMGQLAAKADRGDKEALNALETQMRDQRFTELTNALDLKETKAQVDHFKSMFGDDDAPLVIFEDAGKIAKKAHATKDTTITFQTSHGSEYYFDGRGTVKDASGNTVTPVAELRAKSTDTFFAYPQEVAKLEKWKGLADAEKRVFVDEEKGIARLMATDAATGKRVQVDEILLSRTPVKSLSPVELFSRDKAGKYYKDVTLGSPITSVEKRAPGEFTENGLPKMAGSINLNKFSQTRDVDALIAAVNEAYGPAIARASGSPHDAKYLENGAQRVLLRDIIGQNAERFNDVEAMAIRGTLITTGNRFKKLAKIANDTGDPMAKAAAHEAFVANYMVHQKVAGVSTAFGRQLNVLKRDAGTIRGMYKQVDEMLTSPEFKDSNFTRVLKELASDDRLDDVQLQKMLGGVMRTTSQRLIDAGKFTYDVFYEVFVNAYLSGALTHAKNMVTNSATTLLSPTKVFLEGLSAGARGFVMGDDVAKMKYESDMKQSQAMMAGMMGGISDAFRLATGRATKTQVQYPEELMKMHEIAQQRIKPKISSANFISNGIDVGDGKLARFIDFVGNGIRLPGEALLKEDKAFKLINYRMGVNQEAAKRAFHLGQNADDQKAIFRMFSNNPDEFIKQKAIDLAELNTFTNSLGETGRKFEAVFRLPGLNLLTPFFRTPTNIIKYGVKNSVFGNVFNDIMSGDFLKATAKGDVARANIAVGTLVPASILAFMPDDITVTGDIDTTTEAGRLKAAQTPPYSFVFRNKDDGTVTSLSYEGIEPLRSIMGMMVNYKDIFQSTYRGYVEGTNWDDKEADEILGDALATTVGAFTKTIKSAPYFDFVGDLHNILRGVLNGDADPVAKQLQEMAANMLAPNIMAQTNKTEFDNTFRMAEEWTEKLKKRCWGLSKELPIRPDAFGEPQYAPRGTPLAMVNPFLTKTVKYSKIANEMIRTNVSVPRIPNKFIVDKIELKLDTKRMSDFGILVGRGFTDEATGSYMPPLKEHINDILEHPAIANLKPGEFKDKTIKARVEFAIQQRREGVKAFMIQNDPELNEKLRTVRMERELQAQQNTIQ